MKNYILFFLLLGSFSQLSADYLFQPLNICVKSYQVIPSSGTLNYVRSHDNAKISTTTKNYGDDFFPDFYYDPVSGICSSSANNTLGMDSQTFNNLSGFMGLLIVSLFVWALL